MFDIEIIKSSMSKRGVELPLEIDEWSDKPPSFPAHHFRGGGMSLPFAPADFVYSPPTVIPISPIEKGEYWAFYKRGISKFRRKIAKGEKIDPVILLIAYDGKSVGLQDGNHRMTAAQQEGLSSFPCRVGMPKKLFQEWKDSLQKEQAKTFKP